MSLLFLKILWAHWSSSDGCSAVLLGVFHVAAVSWWLVLEHSQWLQSCAQCLGGVTARLRLEWWRSGALLFFHVVLEPFPLLMASSCGLSMRSLQQHLTSCMAALGSIRCKRGTSQASLSLPVAQNCDAVTSFLCWSKRDTGVA